MRKGVGIRVELDNAQTTPHIDITDRKGTIQVQISLCADGVLINGKNLDSYPKRDGIPLYSALQQ